MPSTDAVFSSPTPKPAEPHHLYVSEVLSDSRYVLATMARDERLLDVRKLRSLLRASQDKSVRYVLRVRSALREAKAFAHQADTRVSEIVAEIAAQSHASVTRADLSREFYLRGMSA